MLRLILTNMTGYFTYMCAGAIIAYPSIYFPYMNFGTDEKLLFTTNMVSWLASFDGLFAIPGAIIALPLMNEYGRKFTLIIISVVMTLGWLLQVAAFNLATVALSRLITGIGLGMDMACLFVYITEISPPKSRGIFSAFSVVFSAIGAILVTILGDVISWRWSAVMCLSMSALAAVFSIFMYETPRWLVGKGHREAAIRVMTSLMETHDVFEIKTIIDEIEANVRLVSNESFFKTLGQMLKPPLLKPFVISQMVIVFQQFSGNGYINSYTLQIFQETIQNLKAQNVIISNPYYESSIVWVAYIIGALMSIFIIDRFGRRILLIFAFAAIASAFTAIGAYDICKLHSFEMNIYLNCIPILGIFVYNFSFAVALGSVPYLLLGEFFPLHLRTVSSVIGIISRNAYFFILAKVFPTITIIPIGGIYFLMGGFSLAGLVFVYILVPETKKRSLEEIQLQWYKPSNKYNNVLFSSRL